MTNAERREGRFQRRRAKRLAKKQEFLASTSSYDEIFTFEHLWNSFYLCRKEVSWKPSIQLFQNNLTCELVALLDELKSKEGFISRGFIEFNLCERGKMRHIRSVDIKERVVQRCFCDYYLVPLLTRGLIHDNGASLKNKGITFALDRFKEHLRKYYRKYGTNEGWILQYDFSDYFGSINHQELYKIVDPLIVDDRCLKLYHHLIDAFGDVGLGLGSQVSQVSAVAFPNKIDHKIANFKYTEANARYMDDGYAIFHTKEQAIQCMELLISETQKLGIKLNPKKIRIGKLNRNIIYLKKRFFLTETGKVIMRLDRKNIYKHKRRIKKLLGLVEEGKITIEDVENSHKSYMGQVKKYHNHKALYELDKYIRRLLDDYNSDHASDS